LPLIVREQKVMLLAGGRGGWEGTAVTLADAKVRKGLLRRGFALEYATLAWNVTGIVVLASRRFRRGRWRWLASPSIR
jgi:hypothetical protein